jgi:hypothetical protein
MMSVVCHDAGGAELVSSYLRRNRLACDLVLEGPARNVFRRKLGDIAITPLDRAIERGESLLCGTSWQSDLEWRAIRLARAAGKRSVAFLDHWVNYRERFERQGELCLPDEIWVGDEYAARLAAACFGGLPIRTVGNPYLQDMQAEIQALRGKPCTGRVSLYVCEPVRAHARELFGDERHLGYVEEEAIEYFLRHLPSIAPQVDSVLLRLHPSETPGKYSWVAARANVPVRISSATTLLQDIALAEIVVGCESMAMVVALMAGRRVLSSIPPGGRPCVLPHTEIESIQTLVERSANHERAS